MGPVIGLISQFAVTGALAATVGLSGRGWVVGISVGVIVNLLLARGLVRHDAARLGPADRVTLTRATLAGGVAALVADSFDRPTPLATLLALTVVALVLDAVDGWVARRTRTVSALGARFDGEVDAFLILVLSVYVARSAGAWVLVIGAARYAFLVVGWLVPWMGRTLPARYWRKVVAATQGIALTVAASVILPPLLTEAVLVASFALLAESFGRDVGWLWLRRPVAVQRARLSVPASFSVPVSVPVPVSFSVPASGRHAARGSERENDVTPHPSRVTPNRRRGSSAPVVRPHRPVWPRHKLLSIGEHELGFAAGEACDG
jgi:phosphatidylglycerophosphate synthase